MVFISTQYYQRNLKMLLALKYHEYLSIEMVFCFGRETFTLIQPEQKVMVKMYLQQFN